jgi:LmbE family N-acetylglucosaminyl deacetylase
MLTSSALLLPSLATGAPFSGKKGQVGDTNRKLKIVVVGAHPDDPESGCGGTIALYTDQGHEVVNVYLTRGEAGIPGKSFEQAAAIRTAECQKACAILKARPIFAGQIDGNTELNKSTYEAFRKILDAEKPDVVFTHWPVDTHRDHRAASLLAYDVWLNGGKKSALYYFEVDQGEQTQVFHPTYYVDISRTASRKRDACLAHASQEPQTTFYPQHETMARFRGIESGTSVAEGFIRHCQNGSSVLPES